MFDFVMPESANTLSLYPQPTSDGLDIISTEVPVPSGDRTIVRRTLSSSTEAVLKSKANAPVLSPDGLRYLYVDNADAGALHAPDLNGANNVKVLSGSGASSVRHSPDGLRVAYLAFDNAKNCSHIETVKADGSEANTPTRVYDCGVKGRFITELAWVVAPWSRASSFSHSPTRARAKWPPLSRARAGLSGEPNRGHPAA